MPTVSTCLAWYSWYSRPSVYHRLFELTRITYSPTAFQLWYKYKLYLILLNSYQVPLFGWWLIKLLEDRVRSVPIPVNGASMEKPGAGRLIRCVRRPGAWPTSSRQITVLCNLLFNCLINHSSDESSHYSITVLYSIIRYYSITVLYGISCIQYCALR